MEVTVFDPKGKKTSKKLTVRDDIFAIEPNDHAIWLDVKHHMANLRQGTHKAKERGEIAGSTRKIKRQKGTGTARAGSIKNPLFRGGGRVFGPRVRDYNSKLNKKLKQLARKSALTYKGREENLVILQDPKFDAPKTKSYLELLSNMDMGNEKTLLVLGQADANVYLSSRNISKATVKVATELSTYDILEAKKLILCESSIKEIENILS